MCQHKLSLTLSKLKLITDHLPIFQSGKKQTHIAYLFAFDYRVSKTHGKKHLLTPAHEKLQKMVHIAAVIRIICLFFSSAWILDRKGEKKEGRRVKKIKSKGILI